MINSICAIGLLLASVYFAIVCDSLQGFLRSRLALLCRKRRKEDRFGDILKNDELAIHACKFAFVISIVPTILLLAYEHYQDINNLSTSALWFDLVSSICLYWLLLTILPWTIARVAAEHVLYHSWPLIQVLSKVFRPMIGVSQSIDTLVHRVAGRQDPTPENLESFAEEIQSVVDEGEREGILESRAGKMIQRVMELRQEDVRAAMTPRTDIIAIQVDRSLSEARAELLDAGHSRIPVVEGSTDEIVGILYARDLLEHFGNGQNEKTLRDIVRPAFYIPETTSIHSLLDTMKQERLHMAVVLDEYGGVTGLVTLEDVLEEIVGNIADEFDETEPELYRLIDNHTLSVEAKMHLDELNDLFDLNFPEDRDFDTVGGFVFSELGRVPKQGDSVVWENLRISVQEATERKIVRLEIYNNVPWPQAEESTESTEPQEAPSAVSS
ncbi:MAG: HlyC/CorC family transporter [Planctomycetaceae bacterium]|nr:HlyC/CorC family transporter [Planctomycetaceae bacterium]